MQLAWRLVSVRKQRFVMKSRAEKSIHQTSSEGLPLKLVVVKKTSTSQYADEGSLRPLSFERRRR